MLTNCFRCATNFYNRYERLTFVNDIVSLQICNGNLFLRYLKIIPNKQINGDDLVNKRETNERKIINEIESWKILFILTTNSVRKRQLKKIGNDILRR